MLVLDDTFMFQASKMTYISAMTDFSNIFKDSSYKHEEAIKCRFLNNLLTDLSQIVQLGPNSVQFQPKPTKLGPKQNTIIGFRPPPTTPNF